jgi:hypothetical protein
MLDATDIELREVNLENVASISLSRSKRLRSLQGIRGHESGNCSSNGLAELLRGVSGGMHNA